MYSLIFKSMSQNTLYSEVNENLLTGNGKFKKRILIKEFMQNAFLLSAIVRLLGLKFYDRRVSKNSKPIT